MSPNPNEPPVLAVGITETWLKSYISDAQISIPGYISLRADREFKIGGGCLLYINKDVPITKQFSWSDRQTSLVTAYSEQKNLFFACIYRPPDTDDKSYAECLTKLQVEINGITEENEGRTPEIVILGDFNLPNMDWETMLPPAQGGREVGPYHQTLEFVNENFITQLVTTPTRGTNILDLVFTNTPEYFANVVSTDSKISDHRVVECTMAYNPMDSVVNAKTEDDPFRKVKIHNVDYLPMKTKLCEMDWDGLLRLCKNDGVYDLEQFRTHVTQTVLEIAEETLPRKAEHGKGKPYRQKISEPFKRKGRKLKKKLEGDLDPLSKKALYEELELLADRAKEKILENLDQEEINAVETIKSNPRFFYSYAKKKSKSTSTIAPLRRKDGSLTTDSAEKAQLLQNQYVGVFSNPADVDAEKSLAWIKSEPNLVTENFDFTPEEIQAALKEIDPYGAAPDGDIPARILYECRAQLCYPLWLLWSKSMEEEVIPPSMKRQQVVPIFKKGDRTRAENYRPVSLTSNVIKTFERVMKKHLVQHFEENKLFPESQHGFRKQRSCLTQLIEHVDTILKELRDGNEVDVIYVDYAKAFDKVDISVLLAKLERYGIRGKVLSWIRCFLTDRYQTVVVDGKLSSLEKVLTL